MNEQWSDNEVDAGLRRLFADAPRPAAPASVSAYARDLVAGSAMRPVRTRVIVRHGSPGVDRTVRRLAAATAILALVVVGGSIGARVAFPNTASSPSASPSASVSPSAVPTPAPSGSTSPTATASTDVLPTSPVVDWPPTAGANGFTWHLLPLKGTVGTEPSADGSTPTLSVVADWTFLQANGRQFAVQSRFAPGLPWAASGPTPRPAPIPLPAGTAVPVWISADGVAWSDPGSVTTDLDAGGVEVSGLVWTGSQYVAFGGIAPAGQSGSLSTWRWRPTIWTSPDGIDWQVRHPSLAATSFGVAAYGNGVYLAMVGDALYRSTDLAHWTETLASDKLVAFANGTFVAADDNRMLRSTDGLDWVSTGAAGAETLAIVSGRFAAIVGAEAGKQVITSSDGRHWATTSLVPFAGGTCNRTLLWCPGGGAQFEHTYSPDGVSWVDVPVPSAMALASTMVEMPMPGLIVVGLGDGRSLVYYSITGPEPP